MDIWVSENREVLYQLGKYIANLYRKYCVMELVIELENLAVGSH